MLQDFINRWLGNRVDFDGAYGYQCVDLVNQYILEVFGIHAGAWGDAKDYFFNPAVLEHFDQTTTSQPGDIVVIRPTNTNPYGHIGVVTGSNQMLEQNGVGSGTGKGNDAIRYRTIPSGIYGYLRRKGGNMITERLLEIALGWAVGRAPTQAEKDNWIGKNELDNLLIKYEQGPERAAYFNTVQAGFKALNEPKEFEELNFKVYKKKG